MKIKKRGISPVISTVLLIFLVLILTSIVFLWARNFFAEQIEKSGNPIENQCRMIDFSAEVSKYEMGGIKIHIDLLNNGDISIFGILLKEKRGGNEYTDFHFINLYPGYGIMLEADLVKTGNPDEIIIYPILLGEVVGKDRNKEFICIEKSQRILL